MSTFPRTHSALVLIFLTVFVSGCSHQPVKPDEPGGAAGSVDSPVTSEDIANSDRGNAFGLRTVHFGYESSSLDSEAKHVLKENAEILKKNPALRIQIEGHCDQRGGVQYNLALGEMRAKTARRFLEKLGIAGARISTVSYGKERLIDSSETETAYAKNRRANFVILKTIG